MKPVYFTAHAREKMIDRCVSEYEVVEAIRIGHRKPAERGLWQFRLNLGYHKFGLSQFVG